MFRQTAQKILGFIFACTIAINFLTPVVTVFAQQQTQAQIADGQWVKDDEVTFVGKSGVRAREFLDWTINPNNTNWDFVRKDISVDTIVEFWSIIRNIAYALILVVLLFIAFLTIISRGKRFNIRRQLLIVGGLLILITLSFSIIDFLYKLIDTLQSFFLRRPNHPGEFISTLDLLYIGFPYSFEGLRLSGSANDESAQVSLLLVRATTVTYYVMAGMLLIRKIILWFFIILSPIWVILLPFPLIRNTAKIWMGEFFRWLFYGPLFAILLSGLVFMWQKNIPLNFQTNPPCVAFKDAESCVNYPTAINILLGGPGEQIAFDPANNKYNSVNNVDTYAKYVFALLMLWVVIILPWILLRIFRDVLGAFFNDDNPAMQSALSNIYPFIGKPPPPAPKTPPPPSGEGLARDLLKPASEGLAMSLKRAADNVSSVNIKTNIANIESLPQVKTSDIVKFAGLNIPTMRDIARMDMERNVNAQNRMSLKNIAAPTTITNMRERSKYLNIQQELLSRARKGDSTATTILAAAESARTGQPVPLVMPAIGRMTGRVGAGGPHPTISRPVLMPQTNHVQTVNVDDYEEVKKMWEENYTTGEVPISENIKNREQWIKQEVAKLQNIVELLSSAEQEKKKQAIEEVAGLLPFLLLGGFSEQETTVYLKAKIEAGKKVLEDLQKSKSQQQEEEDKVLVDNKKEAHAEGHLQAEIPTDEKDEKEEKDAANPLNNEEKLPGEGQGDADKVSGQQADPNAQENIDLALQKENPYAEKPTVEEKKS